VKRGTLCWINLEPTKPPEFGKVKPGVVIYNSEQNVRLPTVVILPVSSQAPEIWPLRIEFQMPNGKKSYLVLPGIRQVAKERIQETIGVLSSVTLRRIEDALNLYLRD
jgi:mRNA-degrading endonuclease toxin of MazEF toxin-antitoxin module